MAAEIGTELLSGTVDPRAAHEAAQGVEPPVTWRNWAALVLLSICWAFAFTDRQILNLMVEAMQRDFGITDQQTGFVLGPAFSITYIMLGLFAGWCADRFNRRNLLIVAGILWSLATFATAFAQGFVSLVATRAAVGAAEAFLLPAGMSMVAEMFDRKRLPVATTVFLVSPYVGGGLAMIIGGLTLRLTADMAPIAHPFGLMHNWQFALALVGALGAVPILCLLLIREPVRGAYATVGEVVTAFGFVEGSRYMLRRWRFFLMFFFGIACVSMMLNTLPAWVPTMFVREFDTTTSAIGVVYGALVLACGIVGGICSPLVNRWLARRYPDSTMRTALIGPVIMAGAGLLLLRADGYWTALACVAAITFGYCFPLPMAGASLQLATPPRLRGLASAYYFVIVSVLGVAIGPTTVPFVTHDLLGRPDLVSVGLAIVTVTFSILALLLLLVAAHGFRIERGVVQPHDRARSATKGLHAE